MDSMHLSTFHGGVRLPDKKSAHQQGLIENASLPEQLHMSLRVNRGFEAEPVVAVGDHVLKGQCIAEAVHPMASNVHASSSGHVVSISQRPSCAPDAAMASVITIKTDGQDQWCEQVPLAESERTPENIINRMHAAGIMGMGGAGFPAHVKYHKGEHAVHTLIINGAECEPYIACDEALMQSQASLVIKGALLMMQASGAEKMVLAIEDTSGGVAAALQQAIKEESLTDCEVVTVPSIYPTGGEKQLIEVLTGEQVPHGETPLSIGLLMQNVATAKAVYDAVCLGRPLISRVVTVTGTAVPEAQNVEALIGTPLCDLLGQSGAQWQADAHRLIIGGPMMGFAMPDDDIGIDKTSNCLLLLDDQGMPEDDMPCIRCGDCVKVCPQDLLPQQLFWYIKGNDDGNDLEKARDHNLFDCIECGACAYVCPSQINLVDYYRYGKAELQYLDFKKQKAEQAKERFESREARLERLKKERQAKRHAKTAKLKDKKVAKKEISDVLARIKQMKDQKDNDE